jgi:RNA polymerase sigma factor (sigma-70 family)
MANYKEIIELVKKKDPSGAERLFEEYGQAFYAYCIKSWQFSEDEAWEVVYKTLEVLILKLDHYQLNSQSEFDRFLYKVLINFLRQQYRSKKFQETKGTVYVDFNAESGGANEFVQYLNEAAFFAFNEPENAVNPALQQLHTILENFDQTDRDLLLLRAQNYSYEEIADLLHIENNQLKVRHHRAKKKLIEQFNQTANSLSHGKK